MKKKILASLLAGIVLATSILPTASFAQEDLGMERTQTQETSQEDKGPVSNDLSELRFFVDDKEFFPATPFFSDQKSYRIYLPRGTKKVTIHAVTRDPRAKIWKGTGEDAEEVPEDWAYSFSGNPDYLGRYYGFFTLSASSEKPSQSFSNQYLIQFEVAGYPRPVIKGVQENYVFERYQKVTRKDLLKNVSAKDEVDGDLTSKIEIKGLDWKEDGFLNTDYRTSAPEGFSFRVTNSHGETEVAFSKCSIVEPGTPKEDMNAPKISVPQEEVKCYERDFFSKEDLLRGVTAQDDIDGDLTKKIQVKPESLAIENLPSQTAQQGYAKAYIVDYSVKDRAGNEGTKRVFYYAYHKRHGQNVEERDKRIQEILKVLAKEEYYGTGEDWGMVALGLYGKADYGNISSLLSQAQDIISKKQEKATEYERIALSLTAAGLDIRNLPTKEGSQINLIETIANHQPMGSNNDYIFALLAYDSGNYPVPEGATWTRKALIDYLLKVQLSQGGWSLEGSGGKLEPDITAMAIQALAPYQDQILVKKALDKALDRLAIYKTRDYGFYNVQGQENSETTAQTILALLSMGINPKEDFRYSDRGGQDVVDGLLTFALASNRFTHTKTPVPGYEVKENNMSNVQAFQALAAYQNFKEKGGKAPYYPFRFKDFSQEKPEENPSKPDKPIDPDTIVTLRDLEILSLPYQTTYEEGEEPSLDGLKVRASYSDGTSEILNNRDLNVFDFSTSSWSPNRIVTIAYGGLKTTFSIQVKEKEGAHKDQANILVKDPKGRTYFPAQNLSIRPGEDTAFSLLQKTGLTYKYNYHKTYSGVYVSAIEGLAEFDGGPNSGWMYRVNGEFPNHSASLHKIHAGDKVEWLYTRDLGKDLGAKFEEEEEGYQVIINHNAGGQVSPSGQVKVKKGENLNLTIKADPGYTIDKVLVDGQDQGKITFYQLSNIDSNHRVEVRFVQVKDLETKDLTNEGNKTLRDIPGHWAQGAMTYCLDKGYFAGKGDGTFGANDPVSRGDLVTVLGRRRKAPVKAEKVFKDVDPNTYYGPYVAWSKKQGLAAGYHGNFRPKDSMTREEMAKVFQEYLKVEKKLSKREKRTFKDQKKISSWAKESVDSLTSQGILQGDEQGNFNPKNPLTRAQVAQVLYQIDQQ